MAKGRGLKKVGGDLKVKKQNVIKKVVGGGWGSNFGGRGRGKRKKRKAPNMG